MTLDRPREIWNAPIARRSTRLHPLGGCGTHAWQMKCAWTGQPCVGGHMGICFHIPDTFRKRGPRNLSLCAAGRTLWTSGGRS